VWGAVSGHRFKSLRLSVLLVFVNWVLLGLSSAISTPERCAKQQAKNKGELFSRFFRQAAKAALGALPRDQQLVYERRAVNSGLIARSNRGDLRARRAAEAAERAPALTLQASRASSACPADGAQVLAVHVPRRAHEIQALLDGASAAIEEPYPLSEEALSARRRGAKVIDICSAFKKACCTFARPPTQDAAFPTKVEYQAACGAMCEARAPPRTFAGYLGLVDGLARVAACLAKNQDPKPESC
jgi:hypothetical protein